MRVRLSLLSSPMRAILENPSVKTHLRNQGYFSWQHLAFHTPLPEGKQPRPPLVLDATMPPDTGPMHSLTKLPIKGIPSASEASMSNSPNSNTG